MEDQSRQMPGVMEDPSRQIPSIVDYIVIMLIGSIPLVGFIFMIIWAVGGVNVPLWRRNYARASLLMYAIGIVIYIVFGSIFLAAMMSMLGQLY
jgi:ABC-type uncharacterized transport system fused permease/ATPase subunit